MEVGTTKDVYDYKKQHELLRGAREVLRGLQEIWQAQAFRYQSNTDDDDKDDVVDRSGKTKATRG